MVLSKSIEYFQQAVEKEHHDTVILGEPVSRRAEGYSKAARK